MRELSRGSHHVLTAATARLEIINGGRTVDAGWEFDR